MIIKTVHLKIKPEAYSWFNKTAIEVNQVFNYCNETSYDAIKRTDLNKKWLSEYELCGLTSGSSKLFQNLGADSIQMICRNFVQDRNASKKSRLRWRNSFGTRRSLGWIPFKEKNLKIKGNCFLFCGKFFRVFESEKLKNIKWRCSCFTEDSLGNWWLCLSIEVEQIINIAPNEAVAIDFGLKTTATTSDGQKLEACNFYRKMEPKIKEKQRRGHKRQAKRLHKKVKNQRKDVLHKFSKDIVNKYQNIIVGNVSSTKLAKTYLAKSVLDAGWGMLKEFLDYKSNIAARSFQIIDEGNTTRACSSCGRLNGPSGLRQLNVREWTCRECGVTHDRDINAAKNILRLRYQSPLAGTSCLLKAA